MKRVSDYINNVQDRYFVTKTGNIYSQQYDVNKFITIIKLRNKGITYSKIAKEVNKSKGTIHNIYNRDFKPLYKKLKGKVDKNGYIEYKLYTKKGKPKYMRGHRILGYCYLNLKDNLLINHKDGIKDNNKLSNLEVVTDSQNKIHAINKLGINFTKNLKSEWNKIKVYDKEKEKTQSFESVAECCRNLEDFCYGYVVKLPKNKPYEYKNRYIITISN